MDLEKLIKAVESKASVKLFLSLAIAVICCVTIEFSTFSIYDRLLSKFASSDDNNKTLLFSFSFIFYFSISVRTNVYSYKKQF